MALLVIITFVLGFVSLLLAVRSFLQPSLRLPPGPRPVPIFGNLLLMKKFASIHDFANMLTAKYGPIATFWMGSRPAFIISGPEIIHEAMIRQGGVFTGRNHFDSVRILNFNFRGLMAGVGERHRFLRKVAVSDIFASSRVAGFRSIRVEEASILIERLKEQARDNDGVLADFRSTIRWTASNLLIGICFGRRLTLPEYIELDNFMVQRFGQALGSRRDFIPLLALFPDKKREKQQWALREKGRQVLQPLIQERKRILASGKAPETTSFVDTLLALQSGEPGIEMTDADIEIVCMDILFGGTDSTSLTLEYTIANIINQPKIQAKLAREISEVVGDRVVDENAIPRLPYLQAVVKESLRRHNPTRLAPARVSLSSTKLAGYDIPANAQIFQHLEAVLMNSKIWENPLEFRPARFLDKTVDITGSTEISLIPFGVGRRICPAINIAFLHIHLLLARLIQAFEWSSATPGKPLDLSPGGGLSAPMKYPLTAILKERQFVF